ALGKGRPGWHIECSAINQLAFKGEPTDIHTGAVDLIFPHHTNEIAQSQALLGKGNFVKHWSHAEHLLVDSKKMAKSSNNFYILKDLAGKVPLTGLALRYLFLQSGYRAQQNFTNESFIASYKALEKLYNILKSHKIIGEEQKVQEGFYDDMKAMLLNSDFSSLGNDLNYPAILSFVWGVLGTNDANIHTQDWLVKEYDKILGLKMDKPPAIFQTIQLPKNVQDLVDRRQQAKEQKDFSLSDLIRLEIESFGYEVMDTSEGQKVKKKMGV
ncbi:MAG TPA: cysteine--tRNA ligase, partial [Candidatus Limnocylindria bacterium]|nr:cysteine--tRNA ligase [Candidatus Limnocylindria bacterium]